jgi:hypothetical protein
MLCRQARQYQGHRRVSTGALVSQLQLTMYESPCQIHIGKHQNLGSQYLLNLAEILVSGSYNESWYTAQYCSGWMASGQWAKCSTSATRIPVPTPVQEKHCGWYTMCGWLRNHKSASSQMCLNRCAEAAEPVLQPCHSRAQLLALPA